MKHQVRPRNKILKMIVIGDLAVGKTELINQFVDGKFNGSYSSTIGVGLKEKRLLIDGEPITIYIYDTCVQEKFLPEASTYYRDSNCCILVYDVTNRNSFEVMKNRLNDFKRVIGLTSMSNFPFLLIGNKMDQPNKAVQPSLSYDFSMMNRNMIFYEVSAKTGENVQTAFENIIRRAIGKDNQMENIPVQYILFKIQELSRENIEQREYIDSLKSTCQEQSQIIQKMTEDFTNLQQQNEKDKKEILKSIHEIREDLGHKIQNFVKFIEEIDSYF